MNNIKKVKVKTITKTSKNGVVRNITFFETSQKELEKNPEYIHLMRISKELNLKI